MGVASQAHFARSAGAAVTIMAAVYATRKTGRAGSLNHYIVTPQRKSLKAARDMTTKMDVKDLYAALLSIALLGISAVASFAVDPTGTWRTEEDATVRVSNCG